MTHKRFRGGVAFLMALIFLVVITATDISAGMILMFCVVMVPLFGRLIWDTLGL